MILSVTAGGNNLSPLIVFYRVYNGPKGKELKKIQLGVHKKLYAKKTVLLIEKNLNICMKIFCLNINLKVMKMQTKFLLLMELFHTIKINL